MKNALFVKLIARNTKGKDETIGILQLINKIDNGVISEKDEDLILRIIPVLSTAIQNSDIIIEICNLCIRMNKRLSNIEHMTEEAEEIWDTYYGKIETDFKSGIEDTYAL